MFRKVIFVTLVFLLAGCVPSGQMDREFYGGLEQGSKEYGEVLGDLAGFIGLYEGSSNMLEYGDWQNSTLELSTALMSKADFLYSITKTYCPRDEDILCDDIKTLYLKTRDMHGSLVAAIKLESHAQMRKHCANLMIF